MARQVNTYYVSYGFRQSHTTGSYLVRAKTGKGAISLVKGLDDRETICGFKATKYNGPDTEIDGCDASDLISESDLAKLGKYEGSTLHLEEGT